MLRCYNRTLQPEWCKRPSKSNKTHQLIAALICEQPEKTPYTAILSTGAHHNDANKCGFTSTCDGHALSIIYEVAPAYFMQEMKNLEQETESIFEYALPISAAKFRLRPGIKFHLIVTGPPCGFIKEQEEPCIEWKTPFIDFPHVPTCSTRILIGAAMGIQGYVSHLLVTPIVIDSLIILCAKNKEHQAINFGSKFPRVEVMEYNPNDFRHNFRDSNLVKLKSTVGEQESFDLSYQESGDQNEAAKSNFKRARDSSLTLVSPFKDIPSLFCAFDPRKTEETGLFIESRDIDESFEVTRGITALRKQQIKQTYNDLLENFKHKEALKKLLCKLESKIEENNKELQSLTSSLSSGIQENTRRLDSEIQTVQTWSHSVKDLIKVKLDSYQDVGKKKILNQNMVAGIKQVINDDTEVIVDCNWHDYLKDLPSSYQTSD